MSVAEQGVYWPFKALLQGSGIVITEDPTTIRIGTTGAGPGGGDMLSSVYATNGAPGVVDKAVLAEGLAPGVTVPLAQQANSVPWNGITGAPTSYPSDWSIITSKPSAFPPSPHSPTHLPTGTDPIALAGTPGPGLLAQLSGVSTDYVGGDNATHSLATAIGQVANPTIWAVRLRSYNAIGNPNGEVCQRRGGTALSISNSNAWLEDRWQFFTGAGVSLTGQSVSAGTAQGAGILLPGTNFNLSSRFLRLTLGSTKTPLAAGDSIGLSQFIEGSAFRELASDYHSLSLLVRSSVPNLKICVALQDPGATRSLVNVVTLGAANTLTLIPLPNLSWPSAGGNFTTAAGTQGYQLFITVGTGSNFWGGSGTEGTWQNGNFIGSPLQTNFAYGPVGSTFDLCFVQHEPGPVCSTFIDLPFEKNFDDCTRYYCTDYDYGVLPGTASPAGGHFDNGTIFSIYTAITYCTFPRQLAKRPTMRIYNASTGAPDQVYGHISQLPYQGFASTLGETGLSTIYNPAGNFPAGQVVGYYYTADTGL